VFWKYALGPRVSTQSLQGLFSKCYPEGVTSILGHRIRIGRTEIAQGGSGRPATGQNSGAVAPWTTSSEFVVMATHSTKLRKKTTNAQRSLSRTRPGTLFEPRRHREGSRRALAGATSESGSLCEARQAVVGGSRAVENKDHGGGKLQAWRDLKHGETGQLGLPNCARRERRSQGGLQGFLRGSIRRIRQ